VGFKQKFVEEINAPVTTRFIGNILRNKLHLRTRKSHGVYILPQSEFVKTPPLYLRYGIEPVDFMESENGACH